MFRFLLMCDGVLLLLKPLYLMVLCVAVLRVCLSCFTRIHQMFHHYDHRHFVRTCIFESSFLSLNRVSFVGSLSLFLPPPYGDSLGGDLCISVALSISLPLALLAAGSLLTHI
ncbi:hypothetical protein DQ04_03821000 [Trypanosoma grayi]|uniref:hypothetical protein n=1 Tax=Trypanosoma grayi TaxID=71804 RepID=UPI0004F48B6E|nr:hypothetical protein DQ04_03821000 [Trypanosoma grayi]KEG10358.1 hypothetical protein DQ04_03821000 [Trypanosoma grayi]